MANYESQLNPEPDEYNQSCLEYCPLVGRSLRYAHVLEERANRLIETTTSPTARSDYIEEQLAVMTSSNEFVEEFGSVNNAPADFVAELRERIGNRFDENMLLSTPEIDMYEEQAAHTHQRAKDFTRRCPGILLVESQSVSTGSDIEITICDSPQAPHLSDNEPVTINYIAHIVRED